MRTPGPGARIPGFVAPLVAPETVGELPVVQGEGGTSTAPAPGAGEFSRRGGMHQLNVRVQPALVARYKGLIRDLEDVGFETSLAEIVQSLLYEGPTEPDTLRAALRRWRHVLDH